MSPQEPQEHSQKVNEPAVRRGQSLRNLPGFTTAAVAFAMVLLLGGGGIAIAKWNQSATATINITAGAAPTSAPTPVPTQAPSASPSPTPAPTVAPTTPAPVPEGSGNIVANPMIAKRPAQMDLEELGCKNKGSGKGGTARFKFEWDDDGENTTRYVVTLTAIAAGKTYSQTQIVKDDETTFNLENKPADYGEYILRVQPMNGDVAGDPVYLTFLYSAGLRANCYDYRRTGPSPLGAFTVNAATHDNVLNLTWTAAKATGYVVSIEQSGEGGYGAEFATTTLGSSLTFPPRVLDQWGNTVTRGNHYFGKYSLRIQPMNGTQAGDPVYKTVQYGPNDFTVW
ncbi:hypothetical protein [Arthrobacter sp. H35-D1]|uniref:hypothetical protein n=1 Tax=Arthrobacter sp. H35-D1 TaxID=3046202 RepID=UPI0024B9AFB9|nr:hypothetical protein [Arthrobacter sp. H35-D1]MDJ0314003.1 hypothetical protein [Arthrobacter sp. H35-D1]